MCRHHESSCGSSVAPAVDSGTSSGPLAQPPANCWFDMEPMVVGRARGPGPLVRKLLAPEKSRGKGVARRIGCYIFPGTIAVGGPTAVFGLLSFSGLWQCFFSLLFI